MKKFLILIAVFLPVIFHAKVLELNAQSLSSLQKISQLNPNEIKIIKTEEITVDNPQLEFAKTIEDSVSLKGQEIIVNNNYVRFDEPKIAELFTETATLDALGNLNIDYLSFIPILMEAIHEQQKTIKELQDKIQELENKINN